MGSNEKTVTLFAFEHAWDIYESGFRLISLHRTLKGAYKAMIAHKWTSWEQEREIELRCGVDKYWGPTDYCQGEKWRIKRIELND